MRTASRKRRDPRLVFACLNQHEAEMVVGLGEIRPQTNGLAELGSHVACCRRRLRPSRRPSMLCASARRFGAGGLQRLPKAGNGGVPVRRGHGRRRDRFSPASNCPSALSSFARSKDR